MIEIICLIVLAAVAWLVASEGVWGAVQIFLCTLFAGLIAMNYFEPLARVLAGVIPDAYADITALLGLFAVLMLGMRLGLEQITPSYIQVLPMLDTAGRYVVGAATGYLMMAILLTAVHTAPLPREFLGFQPERNNFFGMAPDRQWLGFTQYVSEKPLAILYRDKVGDKEIIVAHAFDGRIEKVGDPNRLYTVRDLSGQEVPQIVWPSFPIRYASRRGQGGAGGAASAAPAVQVVPTAPPPATGPGNAAPANPGF